MMAAILSFSSLCFLPLPTVLQFAILEIALNLADDTMLSVGQLDATAAVVEDDLIADGGRRVVHAEEVNHC